MRTFLILAAIHFGIGTLFNLLLLVFDRLPYEIVKTTGTTFIDLIWGLVLFLWAVDLLQSHDPHR